MANEGSGKPANDAKAERAARLAAELRANLKRRKDQARARAADDETPPSSPSTPSDDGS